MNELRTFKVNVSYTTQKELEVKAINKMEALNEAWNQVNKEVSAFGDYESYISDLEETEYSFEYTIDHLMECFQKEKEHHKEFNNYSDEEIRNALLEIVEFGNPGYEEYDTACILGMAVEKAEEKRSMAR